MTDPDERTINRALMYLEEDDEAQSHWKREAVAALHRLFRDRRRLEAENHARFHEIERLRKENTYLIEGQHITDGSQECWCGPRHVRVEGEK